MGGYIHSSGEWVAAGMTDSEAQFPYWQNGNYKMYIAGLI